MTIETAKEKIASAIKKNDCTYMRVRRDDYVEVVDLCNQMQSLFLQSCREHGVDPRPGTRGNLPSILHVTRFFTNHAKYDSYDLECYVNTLIQEAKA